MLATLTIALFLARVEAEHGVIPHQGLRLEAPLTQGAVVEVLSRESIPVTTRTPERPVTEAEVDAILGMYRKPAPHRPHHEKHRHDRSPCEPM